VIGSSRSRSRFSHYQYVLGCFREQFPGAVFSGVLPTMLLGVFTGDPLSAMLSIGKTMKITAKKNAAAQALTALRNKKLTPDRRSEIAQTAAAARWAKKRKPGASESSRQLRPQ
jgi:hypothetical protein